MGTEKRKFDINSFFFLNCSIASFSIVDKFYSFLETFVNEINGKVITQKKNCFKNFSSRVKVSSVEQILNALSNKQEIIFVRKWWGIEESNWRPRPEKVDLRRTKVWNEFSVSVILISRKFSWLLSSISNVNLIYSCVGNLSNQEI